MTTQFKEKMDAAFEEMKQNPELIWEVMYDAGICDKNGELTEHYKC